MREPHGLRVELVNVGAAIKSIRVPAGKREINVVLGYSQPKDYLADPYYLGATVGRYAGRIANGRLTLGEREIQIDIDARQGPHALHGGPGGLHSRVWRIEPPRSSDRVQFRRVSPDGDQGFPGELDIRVTYSLVDRMRLAIEYVAVSDRETVVNLANHAYFNLNGDGGTIDDHHVAIYADAYTVQDEDVLPTGEIRGVAGTPYDLRQGAVLEERFGALADPPHALDGFDQNFVLSGGAREPVLAASLYGPRSGIRMRLLSTQPGMQFYTGQHLGPPFAPRAGLCLEAQRFPDAPNQPGFPSALLRPGEVYRQRTVYAFEWVGKP